MGRNVGMTGLASDCHLRSALYYSSYFIQPPSKKDGHSLEHIPITFEEID